MHRDRLLDVVIHREMLWTCSTSAASPVAALAVPGAAARRPRTTASFDELAARPGIAAGRSTARPLTSSEARAIGGGSFPHVPAAVRPLEAQREEIRDSREALKEATDGNVVSFAYLRSDYTPGAVTLVADAGSSELHDPSRATVTLVADAGSSGLHDLPELP